MIKNVIFDYGNTLASYGSREIVMRSGVRDEQEIAILADRLFQRKFWDRLDDGTISQEEFKRQALAEIPPELHEKGAKICDDWGFFLLPIPEMEALVRKLKRDGFGLYLLSNISTDFVNRCGDFEIFREFDGLVFSGPIGMVKPNREIFEYLLNRYALDPAECVFLDDSPINVEGAKAVGIDSFLFRGNAQEAEDFIYHQKA